MTTLGNSLLASIPVLTGSTQQTSETRRIEHQKEAGKYLHVTGWRNEDGTYSDFWGHDVAPNGYPIQFPIGNTKTFEEAFAAFEAGKQLFFRMAAAQAQVARDQAIAQQNMQAQRAAIDQAMNGQLPKGR